MHGENRLFKLMQCSMCNLLFEAIDEFGCRGQHGAGGGKMKN